MKQMLQDNMLAPVIAAIAIGMSESALVVLRRPDPVIPAVAHRTVTDDSFGAGYGGAYPGGPKQLERVTYYGGSHGGEVDSVTIRNNVIIGSTLRIPVQHDSKR